MSRSANRTLFSVMTIIFLVTACAPAPAATEALAATEAPVATEAPAATEASVATKAPAATETPTATEKTPTATETPTAVVDEFATFIAQTQANQDAQDTQTAIQQAILGIATNTSQPLIVTKNPFAPPVTFTPLPTNSPAPTAILSFYDPTNDTVNGQKFNNCTISSKDEDNVQQTKTITRNPLQPLKVGAQVIILKRVNLRTGPGLFYRRLKILTPDLNTQYKIIGGPAYLDFGKNTDRNPNYSVQYRKYKWWQIEFSDEGETRTGWVAEATACGQEFFIAPAPHLALTKSTTTANFDHVDQVITYTLVATNDSSVTLNKVSISDSKLGTLTCTPSQPVETLAPGASLTCTGSYKVTQADLDAGSVSNIASANGLGPQNQPVTAAATATTVK